ncbi:MAG: hypothetical protein ACOYOO_14205, partial [Saprospiraceae bacterium]
VSNYYLARSAVKNLFTQPRVSQKNIMPPQAAKDFLHNAFQRGCAISLFCGASRQIIFGWRHVFSDFSKQNQKKHVSIQRMFRRRRRQI